MSILLGKPARKDQSKPIRLPKYNLPPSFREKTAASKPTQKDQRPKLSKRNEKSKSLSNHQPKVSKPKVLDLSGLPSIASSCTVKQDAQNEMEVEMLQQQSALIALKIQEHWLNVSHHAKYWIQLDPISYANEMRALGEEERLKSMGLWPHEPCRMTNTDISRLLGNLQLIQQQQKNVSQSATIAL